MRKRATLFVVALLFFGVVTAQTRSISGKVKNSSGVPVPGATIKLQSGAAVAADQDGNFTINTKTGEVLTISSIDFENTTVKVGTGSYSCYCCHWWR